MDYIMLYSRGEGSRDAGMKRHFTELRRQERGDKKRFYLEECIRGCFDKSRF